ncbi:hypothetical protein ACMT1E_04185 [Sphingomonas flavalba]|uniref:hypothetical protein n=1 Tax=Sphingomonas flavalba TaxID=2559804 RepID=UPI0039DFFD9C
MPTGLVPDSVKGKRTDRKKLCLEGDHVPRRRLTQISASQGDPSLPHARCRHCGQLLVKSPVTRRWRLIGMLG